MTRDHSDKVRFTAASWDKDGIAPFRGRIDDVIEGPNPWRPGRTMEFDRLRWRCRHYHSTVSEAIECARAKAAKI